MISMRKEYMALLIPIHRLLILALFLLLSGCANLAPPQNQTLSWENRTAAIARIQDWKIQGVIGIHTAQQALSADLNWQQRQQHYWISLFGPLGTNSFHLSGQPHHVELTLADGRQFTAKDPETLLAEQVGWRLPVSHLYYWIRGLPVPSIAARSHFDAYHHLVKLEQENWVVHYLRYTSSNGMDMPAKLTLDYPGLTVKIVVSQWNTTS